MIEIRCKQCEGIDIAADAWVVWSYSRQAWIIAEVSGEVFFCDNCGETWVEQTKVEPIVDAVRKELGDGALCSSR